MRTEVGRIRSDAQTDQWIQQQDVVPSKLQLVETLDDRTRSQSISMDGQIANDQGEFRYPDGTVAKLHQSGVARFDINDRGTTINLDPEYPQDKRITRDPKTGRNSIQPYTNALDWAKSQTPPLKRNKYNELIF